MVTAIVPVNRLDRAKGRLDAVLRPAERRELALATLRTVLAALREAGLDAVVLTADPAVAAAVGGEAAVLPESAAAAGLNGQLEVAVRGRDEVLILHADLPLANGEALRRLIAAAPPGPSATLVRSRDGGTNAMLLRPPGRFPLGYGPGSWARHREAAAAAGMAVVTVEAPDLELDLDTPDDLAAFAARPGWEQTPAGRLLAKWNVGARPGG